MGMKKNPSSRPEPGPDDMLPEYELDWSKAKPNPYAARQEHGGRCPGAGRRASLPELRISQHGPSLGACRGSASLPGTSVTQA
jgi:hypothetical protein